MRRRIVRAWGQRAPTVDLGGDRGLCQGHGGEAPHRAGPRLILMARTEMLLRQGEAQVCVAGRGPGVGRVSGWCPW